MAPERDQERDIIGLVDGAPGDLRGGSSVEACLEAAILTGINIGLP